jgi:hypothetical protein
VVVNITDKSKNLKIELKYEIHKHVSDLRKLAVTLKSDLLEKSEENIEMSIEVKRVKNALEKEMCTTSSRLVATSVTTTDEEAAI